MAVVYQVNSAGGANELEVDDAGVVKILNRDVAALISAPAAFIADPTGGATEDAEARAAVASILDLLIAKGLMAAA